MVAALGVVASCAVAQGPEPRAVTGRDFGGLRLGVSAASAEMDLAGGQAWLWRDGPAGAEVQRVLLVGDVRVRIGVHVFHATRAAGWVQDLGEPDESGGRLWQVFFYLENASNPTAPAGVSIAADRLPVQALVRAPSIRLSAPVRRAERPEDPFLIDGERALATYLRSLASGEPAEFQGERAGVGNQGLAPGAPGASGPSWPASDMEDPAVLRALSQTSGVSSADAPIFPSRGVFAIAPGRITVVGGDPDAAIIAEDGVAVQYWDRATDRTLQLTARSAVIFLPPGPIADLGNISAEDVRGIYLEGDVVADDGRVTVRSPRVYYDVQRNRALLLDSVFSLYDARRGTPIYVRAAAIRQESRDRFAALRASVSNTAFFTPHVSIGATSITLTQRPTPRSPDRVIADARNITLNAAKVPFFYWPWYVGDPTEIPLESIAFESSSGSGSGVRTQWDLLALLRREAPEGVSADLLLDYALKRGLGVGAQVGWERESAQGSLFAYTTPEDRGTDILPSGAEYERDGETRGIITARHAQRINSQWSLFGELAYISDERLIASQFRELGTSEPELKTAATLRRLEDNTALTIQAKGAINDFVASEHTLQSQGYEVERLPEGVYTRIGDDLLASSAPGVLSYSSSWRAGRLRMSFTEPTAGAFGLTNPGLSRSALGVNPNQSPADRLRAEGYVESDVYRFDTRHEVSAQLAAGPVLVSPFVVGRFTGYDRGFRSFSGGEDDTMRTWAAAGARAFTQIERIDDSVDSAFWDLHRLRHTIEPGITLWSAGTTIDRRDLPVYDEEVESIAEGSVVRLGVDQRWQTERGGPGRWRSVDVATLRTDLVLASDDVDGESPYARFIEFRPEQSNLSDHFAAEGTWQLTEAVGVVGSTIYDLDFGQPTKTSIGGVIQHTPDFSTHAEMRYLNPEDATYYIVSAQYDATRKYTILGSATFDGDEATFQQIGFEVRRRFPNAVLGVSFTYNDIAAETSLGFYFQPVGLGGRGSRLRGLGSSRDAERTSNVGG